MRAPTCGTLFGLSDMPGLSICYEAMVLHVLVLELFSFCFLTGVTGINGGTNVVV